MNLSLKRFQIFRVGTHWDSKGRRRQFSAQMLKDIADEHNTAAPMAAPLCLSGMANTAKLGNSPKG